MPYPANTHSVRLQALMALRTRLEEISTGNGYQTDVRWVDFASGADTDAGSELPCIAITWATMENSVENTCESVRETLGVVLFAGVAGAPRRTERYPNDDQLIELDSVTSDIRAAIGRDRSLGTGDTTQATVIEDDPFPASGERSVAYSRIRLELQYNFQLADPTDGR